MADLPASTLEHYQAMVRLSRQMLEAARQADWPLLVDLGQQRDAIEAQLRARQNGAPQAETGSEQERQLVAVLLAANDQIQLLVETQLASLPAADDGAAPD
jgi:hypothetical protein